MNTQLKAVAQNFGFLIKDTSGSSEKDFQLCQQKQLN
jgi:hypothetical protein